MGILSGVAQFGTDLGSKAKGAWDTVTGKAQADAARDAAKIQKAAADEATAEARRQYDLSRADMSPWLNIGRKNLETLGGQMESRAFDMKDPGQYAAPDYRDPGQFNYGEFNPGDLSQDPGYQFRLQQGMKGLQNSAAGRGSLNSGATMKALLGYGQGLASEEMGNAYNRFADQRNFGRNSFENDRSFGRNSFENDRSFGANQFQQGFQNRVGLNQDRFNRLSALAGTGQAAASNLGNLGQNFAQTYGNNTMAGANAQAAGIVGAQNAYTASFNNMLNFGAQGASAYFGGKK